jgi:hypothetical protein
MKRALLRIVRNLLGPAPSPRVIKSREEVYIRNFGAGPSIYHSTNWVFPHVDIYDFAPATTRPFHVLITGGMAEYRQPVEEAAGPSRVELILQIKVVRPEALNRLKMLAEYPARFDASFGNYHTVPIGEAWSEGSQINAILLAPVHDELASGLAFELEEDAVRYLLAVPITADEYSYAVEVDSVDLFRRLGESNLLVHSDDFRHSVVDYTSAETG